ncbi:probable elongation factor 1-delta isoform X2 [Venturia canescens]|uniref:probable elongation factor 1-delta isoform X2 n=1 Tax=Venturia canescens TaxID=32260 RepID=UPI001C9C706F|nr:probable elongation factor 1-delta isoform X2 [Venturia canescens]
MAATALAQERVWFEKPSYDRAACLHFERLAKESQQSISPIIPASGSLVNEIAKARQHLKKSLQCMNGIAACSDTTLQNVVARCAALEKDNQELRHSIEELRELMKELKVKVDMSCHPIAICPPKPQDLPVCKPAEKKTEEEDDVDLFGSDSEGEDAEAAKIREERLAAYNAKKSKKPVLIAKSNIILDVKPWDDETDMKVLESEVRKIESDGLLWGAAKLVPLAYGIHKLQISCVVEDDKVSVDWLTEAIQEIEEYVQSVDIAAFNKV